MFLKRFNLVYGLIPWLRIPLREIWAVASPDRDQSRAHLALV